VSGSPEDVAENRSERQAVWVGGTPWRRAPDATPPDGPDPYGEQDPEWLRIDWRDHLRRVELDTPDLEPHPGSERDPARTELSYVEIGDGPPVVLIHGLGGVWETWLENIPHLAKRWRVIVPDLPGHGDSPMPGWEISIQAYGRLITRLCRHLGIESAPLVGNSMGGFISAEMTVSEPVLVRKLVLVSAAGVSTTRLRREPAEVAGRMARAASPLLLRNYQQALRRPRLRNQMLRHVAHRPSQLRPELVWEIANGGLNAPGIVAAIRGLAGYDILDRLEDVEIPTLIVWGRNDLVVPIRDAFEYQRLLRNSELVIFDQCGHIPMAERPVRFNRLLDRFLADDG
jgi:pimeloyl-ACP methyl ester carboxylesterase